MQEKKPVNGYEEIAHTADLALKVWGIDLSSLFTQAALGMLEMMGTKKGGEKIGSKRIDLLENDLESLLVAFLSMILEEVDKNHIAYNAYEIQIDKNSLSGTLSGYQVISLQREIKAVTFHNLKIVRDKNNYQTTLVFDI